MIQTLIDKYCQALSWLMVLFLALMVVMVFGNVVMRYGFNSGITLSEELSRWLFVWMTFLGGVVALNERAHLGTDSLISRLPVAGRKLCLAVSLMLMLFVCWLIFQGAWEQTKINWDSTSAVMETSMGYFYASGLVFAVLAAPILLLHLWRLLAGHMSESELIGIRESEDMPHGNPHP
ncbi:tripartite ATP-independent periplasmic transporter, DctQ component family protein [Hydrogenophaga sp. RAC07]|uniref:TRAP transporter small permease n=1 Tax=Hydrogenophaga sp. RAC07 TaxID=1842537 RepID=UPI000857F059|nr:TRAP transporter small permease [Hydrogenophaga sp. RAC07]AOF87589.1 tripartite ATP-independent periplasmic transporter, DctQ component family protein [Hydrogenophaga sp. RAC07]